MNRPGKAYALILLLLTILCVPTSAQNRSDEQIINIAAQVLQTPSASRRADADGLFHINWGWGRNSNYDGYFDLNYLRPNNNNTHYSVGQGMVVMVHPEGTPIDMTEMNVAVPGSLSSLLPTNRSLRLRIKGTLNASDIRALRLLGCGVKDADASIAGGNLPTSWSWRTIILI